MWWWHAYGPTPWMFFGPVMTLLFVALLAGGLFLVFRALMQHRATSQEWGMDCCGIGQLHQENRMEYESQTNSHSAVDEYRANTLRQLEKEQREFQELARCEG